MPSNFTSLTVTWFDESDNYVTTKDITNNVNSIPLFTDTGSGEVNECQMVLSGNFGDFISDEISSEIPIDEYDRFRLEVTDLDGNIYDRFFEVKPSFLPTQVKGEGTLLTLDLVGIEYHTQQIHFNRAFWFADGFEVAREIGQGYETNRGTRQPDLLGHTIGYSQINKTGNGFPRSTVNHYEYGFNEDFVYNRWMDQLDKFGGSVDTGGLLDFFDLGFETTGINEITLAIFSQGSRSIDLDDDANLPTIRKTDVDTINLGEQEGGIAAGTGTLVAAWGAPKRGSLPIGQSQYDSGIFQFEFRPEFVSGVTYQTDAKILFEEKHYKSKIDNNTGNTPPTGAVPPLFNEDVNWLQIDMSDEFGDTIQYSEWTDDKAQHWINCGANARDKNTVTDGTTTYNKASGDDTDDILFSALAPSMFDCNIVINDNNTTDGKGFFRTWVDARSTDDTELQAIANFWAYSGQLNLFPRGFRILVDGIGADTFAGNDPNGIPFTNNIAEYDGDGNWFVKYKPNDVGTELDNLQVAVLDDGVMWFFDQSAAVAQRWKIRTGDLSTECFHTYNTLVETDSFDPKPIETNATDHPDVTKDKGTFAKNINSGVKVTYNLTSIIIKNRLTQGIANKPTGDYYKHGAWFCFRFPFSPMNNGGPLVGDVYGTATPSVPLPGLEPSTLTSLNMDFTSRGTFGYTQANSFDYGQLNSIAFVARVNAVDSIGNTLDGVNSARICLGDVVDNVVYADFEIPFVDRYFAMDLPLSSFSIYRARKPPFFALFGNAIADQILPKELSIQNQFEWRNIKWMTIHLNLGYDRFGRYSPEAKGIVEDTDLNNTTAIKILGGTISLSIDQFHFTKPLLAIAKDVTDRSLEPEFIQRSHIATFDQLLNDAKSEVEKQKFQHTQYDLRTSGSKIFDFRFGDGYFFESDELTNREDDSTAPGVKKVKLVTRRIEYSITSPGTGVGGLSRRLIGARRFI